MTRDEAAILCRVADSWLLFVKQRACTPPGEAVRAAFTALVLEAPDTADQCCPALMAFTRIPPGITRGVTQFVTSPSQHADSDKAEHIPVGEAATRLGVTTHAVRAAARRGSLPAIKDNTGCWQISLRDVEKRAWTQHRKINLNPV